MADLPRDHDGDIDARKTEIYRQEVRTHRQNTAMDWIKVVGIYAALFLVIWALHVDVKSRDENHQILQAIQSCTTPEGECSQRNAKQTAEVLTRISEDNRDITAYAALCALDMQKDGTLSAVPSENVKPMIQCIVALTIQFGDKPPK